MIFGGSNLGNGKAVIGTCNLQTTFLECERPFYFTNQVDQVRGILKSCGSRDLMG